MPERDELKELLKKNLEVSQESLKILKKMHRARVMGGILKAFKWIVIILLSLGLYYYIEPYIITLVDTFSNLTSSLDSFHGVNQNINQNNIPPDLLDQVQGFLKR